MRTRSESNNAKIINETLDEGYLIRNEGNPNLLVELFTPNASARAKGSTMELVIDTGRARINLGGHQARTLLRILKRRFE